MVFAKYALTTAVAVVLSSAHTRALTDLKTDWEAYISALAMPTVIDMTQGGHLDIDIGQASHAWTEDGSISGDVYGYAIMGQTPTFPGPSIVVAKDVPISITWHNNLKAPHLLADSVERHALAWWGLGDLLVLFPLERIELVCDFTGVADGTAYELVDVQSSTQSTPYDPRVLQIRIVESLLTDSMTVREIPTTLNKSKTLKTLYEAGGMERNVTLGEMTDAQACPTMEITYNQDKQINISTIADALQCVKGTVEKWNFINPSADAHPFHWHLVHVQCGDTVDTIKTNELKDVAVIPSAGDRAADTITQVCYVACTPGDYLIEDSEREAKDFGFDTTEPYVAHCHILEHEENMMMSWFRIIDDYRAADGSGSSSSSSSGSGDRSETYSGSDSSYSTSGSESWPDVGSEDYDHANQVGQDGLPAKNVSFSDYHGFGTDEYAKYHRCDGHLKKHGAYSSTSGGSNTYADATQQMDKGNVMTAISSTVVNSSKQDQYGNPATGSAAAISQDTRNYVETGSSNNEDAEEYTAMTTGQGYVKTAFKAQDAATANTGVLADVKADGTNLGKTGTSQTSAKTSSGVDGSVANTVAGNADYEKGATTEISTDNTDSETTSIIVDTNQGYSYTKTSGTIADSTAYNSDTVGTTNSEIASTKIVDVNQASAVNSASYESSTLGKPADNTAADANAGQGYTSGSATDDVVSSVEGTTAAQSNAETDTITTPVVNTGTYTGVASSPKIGHLRQCDGA